MAMTPLRKRIIKGIELPGLKDLRQDNSVFGFICVASKNLIRCHWWQVYGGQSALLNPNSATSSATNVTARQRRILILLVEAPGTSQSWNQGI
jgi:hypothetical protein